MEAIVATLDYVEMPVEAVGAQKDFYAQSFGWKFTDYGPDYAAHEEGPCQVAFNGVKSADGNRTAAVLPLVRVQDIEAAREKVVAAGGRITEEIFDLPRGRRFHFVDPAGFELGCYQPAG